MTEAQCHSEVRKHSAPITERAESGPHISRRGATVDTPAMRSRPDWLKQVMKDRNSGIKMGDHKWSELRTLRVHGLRPCCSVLCPVYLCVLCGSENKQRLSPYTALTDWFL
jgi:hypothetical protein